MSNIIRAYITDTTDTKQLKKNKISIFNNDIVLVYQDEQLLSITGYNTKVISLPGQIKNITRDKIKNIINLDVLDSAIPQKGYYQIQDEWDALKKLITSEPNEHLKETVKKLEEAQKQKLAKLDGVNAVAYDILWSLAKIFNPSNFRFINSVLRQARQDIQINLIFDTLRDTEYYDSVDQVDDQTFKFINGIFDSALEENKETTTTNPPKRDEETIIYEEKDKFPYLKPDNNYFVNKEWNRYAIRMIDNDRELFIFLAHKQGKEEDGRRKTDAAGADLIYASRINQSFVFVQYKLLGEKNKREQEKLKLHDKAFIQLETLVSLCDDFQKCPYINEEESIPSKTIRLSNCPVFYKVISSSHSIVPSEEFMEGDYIQACYIKNLMKEKHSNTLNYPDDFHKTLKYSEFTSLVANAHIGSRANVYEDMLTHAKKSLINEDVIAIALEQPRTTSSKKY
jgi:hypothetical protein